MTTPCAAVVVLITAIVAAVLAWWWRRGQPESQHCPRTYMPAAYRGQLLHRGRRYSVATCSENCLHELQALAARDACAFERTHAAETTSRGLRLKDAEGRHAQHAAALDH